MFYSIPDICVLMYCIHIIVFHYGIIYEKKKMYKFIFKVVSNYWCLKRLSRGVLRMTVLLTDETGLPGEKPANVPHVTAWHRWIKHKMLDRVLLTIRQNRTHNSSGDRHWLYIDRCKYTWISLGTSLSSSNQTDCTI
jgi:hypothetical protein